jgi:hypothetical protein
MTMGTLCVHAGWPIVWAGKTNATGLLTSSKRLLVHCVVTEDDLNPQPRVVVGAATRLDSLVMSLARALFEKVHGCDPAPRTASPCTWANVDAAWRCRVSANRRSVRNSGLARAGSSHGSSAIAG